ncbi:MAG: hypothetical protein AB7J13_11130, partial [Pyrinomonadaceae bacterium]
MNSKLVSLSGCLLAFVSYGYALPPLGLTQISPSPVPFSNLELIDQTAYSGVPGGIWTVDSNGVTSFLPISHSTLGSPYSVTRAVKASNGGLYVAANFSHNSQFPFGAALYRLDQPSTPIVSWDSYGVLGVARDLTVFGTVEGDNFSFVGSKFLLDGTIEALVFPPGEDCFCYTLLIDSTPNGFAIGEAKIPMTAGTGPVRWTPDGEISFFTPSQFGDADSIRDRYGADVPNIGWNDFNTPKISYGDGRNFTIFKEDGSLFYDDFPPLAFRVIVSHGDFTVVEVFKGLSSEVSTVYGFFPGIVPGFDNRG